MLDRKLFQKLVEVAFCSHVETIQSGENKSQSDGELRPSKDSSVSRLVQIQREMSLPLMMALVPANNLQSFQESPAAFLQRFRDVLEIDIFRAWRLVGIHVLAAVVRAI